MLAAAVSAYKGPFGNTESLECSYDLADTSIHFLHHLAVDAALVAAGAEDMELAADGSFGLVAGAPAVVLSFDPR